MREKISYYLEDSLFEDFEDALQIAIRALVRQSEQIIESRGKDALYNLFGLDSEGEAEILISDLSEAEKREKLFKIFRLREVFSLSFAGKKHRLYIDPKHDHVEMEIRHPDVYSIAHGIMQSLEDAGYAIWLDDCPEHPAEPEPTPLSKESLEYLSIPSPTYF